MSSCLAFNANLLNWHAARLDESRCNAAPPLASRHEERVRGTLRRTTSEGGSEGKSHGGRRCAPESHLRHHADKSLNQTAIITQPLRRRLQMCVCVKVKARKREREKGELMCVCFYAAINSHDYRVRMGQVTASCC